METFKFEAEINQLMSLIINAFYSNKDVFLRELVSNSSDALDKIRYISLTQDNSALETESKLEIKIATDTDNGTLTVTDTGVGMTREDLIKNLGTVACSGTKAFIQNLKENGDMNLIGQFGVGFYSVYLVADRVEVYSKHNSDKCYKWESDANGTFTITEIEDNELKRGTRIVLHLKENEKKYLEESNIREIIKKHSNYINYPVLLRTKKEKTIEEQTETAQTNDTSDEKSSTENDNPIIEGNDTIVEDEKSTITDETIIDEAITDETKNENIPDKPKQTITTYEFDKINTALSIWDKKSKDVTEEEYKQFYKEFSGEWDDYAFVNHFSVEGKYEFSALLYIPARQPFNMFNKEEKKSEIKLYVRKVFITDKCEDLMPEYLNFVKGVVDSKDLPLNVSREMLQQNDAIKTIRNYTVKRILDCLLECSESSEQESENKYTTFYQNFSKNIKLGIYQDEKNRERLMKLLRYYSSNNTSKMISLKNYIDNMKEGQKGIYYISGESIKFVEDSPFVKFLKRKDMDILYLTDPIDEYMMQVVKDFDGKKFINICKEDLEIDDIDKDKKEEQEKCYQSLCKYMKEILGDAVEKVVISNRIVDVPCTLSSGQFGWSANMERIMKAQAMGNNDMMNFMSPRKTLEINPESPLIKKMNEIHSSDPNDKTIRNLVWLFYETSMISAGFSLETPTKYANRIYNMVGIGLDVDTENNEEDQPLLETNNDEPLNNESVETTDKSSEMEQID